MDNDKMSNNISIFLKHILSKLFYEISPEVILKNTRIMWKKYIDEKDVEIIAIGKSAIPMLFGISSFVKISGGIVCTSEEWKSIARHAEKEFDSLEFIYSSHPLPNENSIKAAESIREILKREKNVVFLISGGGSSLVEIPSIPLEKYKEVVARAMLEGLNIHQLNTIRRYLSEIKGGKILRGSRAKILSLIISDVPGNYLEDISSGLTYMETKRVEDFRAIMKSLGIEVLESNLPPPVSIEEFRKYNVRNLVLGGIYTATSALNKILKNYNIPVSVLSNRIEGEAREVGKILGALSYMSSSAYIIGGEWDVKIASTSKGIGGPNLELVAAASYTMSENSLVLSIGTDGRDGNSPAAGAYIVGRLDSSEVEEALSEHNTYFLFKKLSTLIETGPTGANLADIALLIPDKIFQYLYSSLITFVS